MAWVTLSLRNKELKQQHAYYQMRDLQISREKRQLARRKQYENSVIQYKQNDALKPIKQKYNDIVQELNDKKEALREYQNIAKMVAEGSDSILKQGNYTLVKNENGQYVCNKDGQFCSIKDDKGNETLVEFKDIETLNAGGRDFYHCKIVGDTWENLGITYADECTRYDAYDFTDIISEYGLPDLSSITEDDISSLQSTINSQISQLDLDRQAAQMTYTEDTNFQKSIWENELAMLEEEVNDEEVQYDLEQTDIETQMEAVSQEMQAVQQATSQQIQNSTIKLA